MFLADMPAQGTPTTNARSPRPGPTEEIPPISFQQVAEALRAEGRTLPTGQGGDTLPDAPDPEPQALPEIDGHLPKIVPEIALPGSGPAIARIPSPPVPDAQPPRTNAIDEVATSQQEPLAVAGQAKAAVQTSANPETPMPGATPPVPDPAIAPTIAPATNESRQGHRSEPAPRTAPQSAVVETARRRDPRPIPASSSPSGPLVSGSFASEPNPAPQSPPTGRTVPAPGPHLVQQDGQKAKTPNQPPGRPPAPEMPQGIAPHSAEQDAPPITASAENPLPERAGRDGRERQSDGTRTVAAEPGARAQRPGAGPHFSARAALTLSAAMPNLPGTAEALDSFPPEEALSTSQTTPSTVQTSTTGPILAQRGPIHVPPAQQLSLAVATTPGGEVEVALSPDELGTVRLRIEGREGAWVITVLSDRPETLDLLRRSQPDLAASFSEAGYDNPSFDFGGDDSAGSQEQDAPRTRVLATLAPDGAPAPATLPTPIPGPGRAGLDLKL